MDFSKKKRRKNMRLLNSKSAALYIDYTRNHHHSLEGQIRNKNESISMNRYDEYSGETQLKREKGIFKFRRRSYFLIYSKRGVIP